MLVALLLVIMEVGIMQNIKKGAPYLLRASASGANIIGSLVMITTELTNQRPVSPFFYLALYSASAYFVSNAYEAYKTLRPKPDPSQTTYHALTAEQQLARIV